MLKVTTCLAGLHIADRTPVLYIAHSSCATHVMQDPYYRYLWKDY